MSKRRKVECESRLERVLRLILQQPQFHYCLHILDTCRALRMLAADIRWTLPLRNLHGDLMPYAEEVSLGEPEIRAQLVQNYLHWSAKLDSEYQRGELLKTIRLVPGKPWNSLRLAIKLDQRALLTRLMQRSETDLVLRECQLLRRYVYLSGSLAMATFFGISRKKMQHFMVNHPNFTFRCRKTDWEFVFTEPERLALAFVWYTLKNKAAIFDRVLTCLHKHCKSIDLTASTHLRSEDLPNAWNNSLLDTGYSLPYNQPRGELYQAILSHELCVAQKYAPSHGRCKARTTNFYCVIANE